MALLKKLRIVAVWNVTACRWVDYRRFEAPCCLQSEGLSVHVNATPSFETSGPAGTAPQQCRRQNLQFGTAVAQCPSACAIFAERRDGFRLNLVTVTYADVSGNKLHLRIGWFEGVGWGSADWIDVAQVGASGRLL